MEPLFAGRYDTEQINNCYNIVDALYWAGSPTAVSVH